MLSRVANLKSTLEELKTASFDRATITGAHGLCTRLFDFKTVGCIFVLKLVSKTVGPASHTLQQTIAIDLSIASTLLLEGMSQFRNFCSNADEKWKEVLSDACDFDEVHGITADFPLERVKRKRRQDVEIIEGDPVAGEQYQPPQLEGTKSVPDRI